MPSPETKTPQTDPPPAKQPPQDRKIFGFPRNVFNLGLASFFTDISSEMVYPLLPLFLTTVLGASAGFVGLVEGIAESTASLLMGLIWQKAGSSAAFFVGGALAGIAALLLAFGLPRMNRAC